MDRTNAPGNVNRRFVDEDASKSRPPTLLRAKDFNSYQEELMTIIEAAGITPDADDYTQVLQALMNLFVLKGGGARYGLAEPNAEGNYDGDSIVVHFEPPVTDADLTADLMLYIRAGAANATVNPVVIADNLPAITITKGAGRPLVSGDIDGEGHLLILRYDALTQTFDLQNPAKGISGISNVLDALPVGFVLDWPLPTPPSPKWMVLNGDILDDPEYYAEYFAMFGNMHGGDGINTSGLSDDRALVRRGWDMGRGYDEGRVLGSEQMDMVGAATGSVIGNAVNLPSQLTGLAGGSSLNHVTAASLFTRTGAETTMKNRAWLGIVKIL